jgi:hypothetical protein
MKHEWRYGTIPEQRNHSARVARALTQAGIPDVTREKRVYYGDPATAVWVVSFPETYKATATRISDGILTPSEARAHRASRKRTAERLAMVRAGHRF